MKSHSVRLLILTLMLAASLLVLAPVFGQAQQPAGDTCTALAQRAIVEVGQSCADMERNSACYGFNRVGATFFEEPTDDIFSKPSDRAPINTLSSIQTTPLDELLETWGIAVLRLQANIPNTLPGQNVIFILMGDTQVHNAVPADQAAQPSDVVVDVVARTRARLRSLPDALANVLTVADSGQVLQADAVDPTGQWVRVVVNDVPGWMSRDVLSEADFSALPVITADTRAPMQSFYLTTGLGDPQCNETPSMLIVQGPRGVKIDLTVNEANIQIGSTIILRLLDANTMEITVLDGEAIVNNLVVPAGFKAIAPVNLPGAGGSESTPEPEGTPAPEGTAEPTPEAAPRITGSLPAISGPWQGCRPLTLEEQSAIQSLTGLPLDILNYPITMPGETNAFCQPPGSPPPAGGNTGDGPQSTPEPVTIVDCRAFRATSPLDGSAFGLQQFYWDPAPGATSYRVNLFRADGSLAGSFSSTGATTNLTADTSVAGGGFQFAWMVEALLDGQMVCTSQMVTIPLAPPPVPTQPAPTPAPEETPPGEPPPQETPEETPPDFPA